MIKKANEFGKLTFPELRDFELANEVILPKDYTNFLFEFNGGEPEPGRNELPATAVNYILGMHNGDYYASLYKHIDMFKGRLPLSTFPIATDVFGNLFLMSLHTESIGNIFFWDHEGEPETQDGHYTGNCSFVAYSFGEFLGNLK